MISAPNMTECYWHLQGFHPHLEGRWLHGILLPTSSSYLLHLRFPTIFSIAVQGQTAVAAHFSRKQLLMFAFAGQCR